MLPAILTFSGVFSQVEELFPIICIVDQLPVALANGAYAVTLGKSDAWFS